MASRTSLSLLPVATQLVISLQKVPAPTAAGIWSEPSKRKTAFGSCRICADSLSTGDARFLGLSSLLALTQPPPGVALALLLAHSGEDS